MHEGVEDGGQGHGAGANGEAEGDGGDHEQERDDEPGGTPGCRRASFHRPRRNRTFRLSCLTHLPMVSVSCLMTSLAAVGPALRYQGSSSTFTACPASTAFIDFHSGPASTLPASVLDASPCTE